MTKLLDEAIAKVRGLTEAEQDLAAEVLLDAFGRRDDAYHLTAEQIAEAQRIRDSVRADRRGLARDEDVAALWKSCGP